MNKALEIKDLELDPALQPRAAMDQATVDDYTEVLTDEARVDPWPFPPVSVVFDGQKYWLWDGFHRVQAAQNAGIERIPATVQEGDRSFALWCSVGANKTHGLRRTNADKRRATEQALLAAPGRSDRELAGHVGVSDKTVGKIRAELAASAEIPQIETRTVQRGGQVYELSTANIGGGQPEAPDPAELSKQLRRALHYYAGAADRWAERRQTGLSNDELSEAIGQEFGNGGASGPSDPGYSSKGGQNPHLWLGHGWRAGKPALQGAALRDAARELLKIPYPSFNRQLEMQAATEAAHERNLLLLSQTAGPATSDALALEQVRKLQVQAIERFNRIIETTIVEDLEAINALLEDFELDTPPEK